MLNIIWSTFFILAFISAIYQSFALGNFDIWNKIISSSFKSAEQAFEISIGLTGILCLWMGLLKIAEKSGITNFLCNLLNPFFKKIMPEIPENHPAIGSIVMNIAANILGLDNAATPAGLKAMEQMQEINKKKDEASNAQIMFMVLNSSSITLIPITILMYRAQMGSINPSAVFIPILLATSISTIAGFFAVCFVQKINILDKVILSYLAIFAAFIISLICFFISLEENERFIYSSMIGNSIIFTIMISFIISGLIKRINVYETFVEGAKNGFNTAIKIIPYLVAMLVAIAVFRTSGVLDYILNFFTYMIKLLSINSDFVPALPTAFMKPLSGSGARAMMLETYSNYGVDNFPSFVASILQGSTETTFYVLAIYFGAVKISKTRHALHCALFADFCGIIAAIYIAYLFY